KETAQKIRALDFNTVQLDLHFRDIDLSAGQINKEKAKTVRDTFRDHNLPVCCVSGYTNIIHPDMAEREKRVGYLKEIIRSARDFGSPYVISETGTYNTESDWVHHPKNKTEEGFEECRKVIADLAQTAYDHGAVFLLETYVNNVVGSVEETVKMFAQVDHPGLGLLMDPTNYFETHNIDRMDQILNQVFDTLTDKIKIAHAKD
ncbi:MAG: sugar phosphate isomerase/epimerase, partial [Mesorhizobium sp.]